MCKLIAMVVLLITTALTLGCYTIVGYRAAVEKGIIEEEAAVAEVYRDHEYYYDRPYSYYRDYYDPYYGLRYPYSYYDYYRDYPYWSYDRYYYRDYDGRYVPGKKRETRRRGTIELRRVPKPELKDGNRSQSPIQQEDEERKQSSRRIRSRRGTDDRIQRSEKKEHRDSTSGSGKRSTKRKAQDEEK